MAVLFGAVAMLLPSLAMADGSATGGEVVTTAPPAPTDTTPVAAQPVVDPVVGDAPVTEAPATPPTTEAPAPPPSTTDPTTPPEAEATPAPAPAPVATDPAAPSAPSTLPTAPDAPKVVVEPDKVPLAAFAADHQPVMLPAPSAKVSVDASVPDAPTSAKPAAITPKHTVPPAAHVSAPAAPLRQNIFTLDPNHPRAVTGVAPTVEQARGMPLAGRIAEPTLFADTAVTAVGGSIQSGSSLLAVLAGYVLPGVGGPPATTIIMFMLVGLIVGLAHAPRPQLSERLHLGGLLAARSGHGLAVCRPG